MSANIAFSTTGGQSAATAASSSSTKARLILPYDVLINLQGRRVTVLLSIGNAELEGMLRTVDTERGDLFLEDVVHYHWQATEDHAAAAGGGGMVERAVTENVEQCAGGGTRSVVRRCASAMVNSRFVSLITPTQFGFQ